MIVSGSVPDDEDHDDDDDDEDGDGEMSSSSERLGGQVRRVEDDERRRRVEPSDSSSPPSEFVRLLRDLSPLSQDSGAQLTRSTLIESDDREDSSAGEVPVLRRFRLRKSGDRRQPASTRPDGVNSFATWE